MRVSNLNSIEYSAYFKSFIKKATDVELLDGLMQNKKDTISFFKSIPESKLDFAYDTGKWTVKQLLLHLIDVERIFVYRALRIARNDNTPLLSFDENLYATESQALLTCEKPNTSESVRGLSIFLETPSKYVISSSLDLPSQQLLHQKDFFM